MCVNGRGSACALSKLWCEGVVDRIRRNSPQTHQANGSNVIPCVRSFETRRVSLRLAAAPCWLPSKRVIWHSRCFKVSVVASTRRRTEKTHQRDKFISFIAKATHIKNSMLAIVIAIPLYCTWRSEHNGWGYAGGWISSWRTIRGPLHW